MPSVPEKFPATGQSRQFFSAGGLPDGRVCSPGYYTMWLVARYGSGEPRRDAIEMITTKGAKDLKGNREEF